jgi:hypothetical protein
LTWLRLALVVLAALVILAGGVPIAQQGPAGDPSVHSQIGRSEDCPRLRAWYSEHHSVWKSLVRHNQPMAVEHLAYMVAILKRLEALQDCDGGPVDG